LRLTAGSIKFCSPAPRLARMMMSRLPLFTILECTLMLTYPCGHMLRKRSRAASPFYVILVVYADQFRNQSCSHSLSHLYQLAGLTNQSLVKLQSILNAYARLIFLSRMFDHMTPLLCELHWLYVEVSRLYVTLIAFVIIFAIVVFFIIALGTQFPSAKKLSKLCRKKSTSTMCFGVLR
jgi:hypothetical protein